MFLNCCKSNYKKNNNIFLGFYNYPGRHSDLLKLLDRELGDIAYFRDSTNHTINSYDLTFNTLRKAGKNILIMYNAYEESKGKSNFDTKKKKKRTFHKPLIPINYYIYTDSKLVWPSWKRYSTIHVKHNDLRDYMKKMFSRKYEDAGWTFVGVQGVDISYVSNLNGITLFK